MVSDGVERVPDRQTEKLTLRIEILPFSDVKYVAQTHEETPSLKAGVY